MAQDASVSLELNVDAAVSGSIDGAGFNRHRHGLATGFQSAAVTSAIALRGDQQARRPRGRASPRVTRCGEFPANAGATINAIWLNERDFLGLASDDAVDAFDYGSTRANGGRGASQVIAADVAASAGAIERGIECEIIGEVPEPDWLALPGPGVAGLGVLRRRLRG